MKQKFDQKQSNAGDRYFFFFHSLEKLDAKPFKNVSFTVQIIAIYHFTPLPSVLKGRCRITSQRPVDTLLIYDLLRDSHTSTRIHGVYRPCQTIPFNGIRRIRLNLPNTSFKARIYRGYRRELVSSRFYTAFVPLDCLQARNQPVIGWYRIVSISPFFAPFFLYLEALRTLAVSYRTS